ncbi:hypothetical protein PFICI_01294 [Pestalotiopsis fici W106-1]|uniref:AB hydrolase-1 domain-containing protein n=1 Tax=Pestalotiopsis fici (strain W106-1 / CGMCC3.15140) TaxID=1229662 RepID=W3XQC5_PESFW|nr:uncharacterized protein PFICI_01294 [Pestalotiopsis fici W106-1]ETS87466.1 hypothetical protein PFICI_01294 [Pestalotiopsis fici W106-1]
MTPQVQDIRLRRESRFLQIGEYKIFVEIDGSGPYILMTHGLGSNTNAFQPLTDIFSKQYTVVRIDWPGHGHSSLHRNGIKFSVPDLVYIIQMVVQKLHIPSVVLVGHSAGGVASMIAAAEYPEMVRGLAVLGAGRTRANQPASKSFTLSLARQARDVGTATTVDDMVAYNIPSRDSPLARALLRTVTASTSAEGYAQMCEALCADSHIDPDYSKIICPTCIIGGAADPISPVSVTDELVGLIATSGRAPKRFVLETGHMMIFEDINETANAIRTLLNDVTF